MLGRFSRFFSVLPKAPADAFLKHQSEVSKVAPYYAFMNDAMTFRIHFLWKKEMANMLGSMYVGKPLKFLDLCAGNGDVACKVTDKMRADLQELYLKEEPFTVSIVECNPVMAGVCKARMIADNYPFSNITEAKAEELPFQPESFDAVLCSFGFRSIQDKEKALSEVMRVLKPGGRLLTLEFGKIQNPLFDFAVNTYMKAVVPMIGQFWTQNYDSYEYLANTIDKFYSSDEWSEILRKAGFSLVSAKDMMGGVVMVHSGVKLL